MPRRPLLAPLVLTALLVALIAPRTATAGEGWWGDLDKGQLVDLADVIVDPQRFKDRQITFTCITNGKANVFFQESAIVSRQRYSNYAVWPDGAVVWRKADYVGKDFPFLFIAKSHFQHDDLLGLRKYTRIEVTGRIKAILRNKAHIEVTSWRPTSHRFGNLVFDAMLRGDKYAEARDFDLAVEKYKQALRPDLPPKYALIIRKELAAALRQLGRDREATSVEGGGILTPDDFRAKPAVPGAGVGPTASAPPPDFPIDEPAASVSRPPIDDQLPGRPSRLAPNPAGPGSAPAVPLARPRTRAERENPFLDDELPGTRRSAPREKPAPVPIRLQPRTARPRPAGAWPNPTPAGARPNPMPAGARPPAGASKSPFASGAQDLPGTPVAPRPPAVAPAVAPGPSPAPSRGRPILPPKRRPRLAGVK